MRRKLNSIECEGNRQFSTELSIYISKYKQYMDELRAKRAESFDARNVPNCVKL